MIEYPNILNSIFDKLNEYNYKPIIVGGYIRDNLLNIYSKQENRSEGCFFRKQKNNSTKYLLEKDIDIEVYGVSSYEKLETLLKEFGSVNSVGKSFGVCKLNVEDLELDFTLPRVDSKIRSGHLGFDIKIDSNLDFIRAARRRDFTINSIGYDPIEKKILDPYNGIKDLKNSTLKAVDRDKFVEDPLRVLRAVQFCARFNLTMDRELFLLCTDMIKTDMLNELSKERVFKELKKLLLKAHKPSLGFEILMSIGAVKYFPQLNSVDNFKAVDMMAELLYPEYSQTSNEKRDMVLMLAALFHTFESDAKLEEVRNFIFKISDEKELPLRILALIKNLHTLKNRLTNPQLYILATKVNISELILLDCAINGPSKINIDIKKRAKELNILYEKIPPILKGRDIIKFGIKPSKIFSEILNLAYIAQMNEEFNSLEEANVWLREYLLINKINL